MADNVEIDETLDNGGDVEMEGSGDLVASTAPENALEEEANARVSFLDYLRSPIVQLSVGSSSQPKTILSAHQDLLTKSPYFEQLCATLTATNRTLDLTEDLDAVGSFLEYLYNGEYFPRRLGDGRDTTLEKHASIPDIDADGEQLLKHARIYTLAEKVGLPALKALAQRKIRLTTSTARGEIAYARYVYASTSPADSAIREPVAKFWATRSYVLRHDAEEEFRAMCLEFPQFGFDVLSKVLDQQEKQRGTPSGVSSAGDGGMGVGVSVDTPGRGRKRGRLSEVAS